MENRGDDEYKRLTMEDVRKYPGFAKRTDKEIQRIITALERLAEFIYKKVVKSKTR
jgi:hypothetical protein